MGSGSVGPLACGRHIRRVASGRADSGEEVCAATRSPWRGLDGLEVSNAPVRGTRARVASPHESPLAAVAQGVIGDAIFTAHQQLKTWAGEETEGESRLPDDWGETPAPAQVGHRMTAGVFRRPAGLEHADAVTNNRALGLWLELGRGVRAFAGVASAAGGERCGAHQHGHRGGLHPPSGHEALRPTLGSRMVIPYPLTAGC
jgi:hypothetical protein